MGQADLGAFETDDEERPRAAEAAAVAGNGDGAAEYVDTTEQRFQPVDETVEFAVTQVNYTVTGRGEDERPIIHVFGRTADRDRVHARVHGFRPYFYAPADSVSADELRSYDGITGWEEANDDGEPYESIRGERVWKIFGRTPRDVGQVRDEFDHYEADIPFPNRFFVDKDLTSGIRLPCRAADDGSLDVHHEEVEPAEVQAEPRVSIFDIEVDDRSGFPEDGEEPIICIASHDSYRDEYVLWIYAGEDGVEAPDGIPEYEPIREGADLDVDVRVFGSEERMLGSFLDYIDATDPDLTCGWNFDDFDAPYLLDRLEVLDPKTDEDLDPDRLSRVDEVWRSNWQGPNIKGRVVFDLLYAYQRTQFTELESYRLDAVGERELGVGKERYAGDIGDLWEQDPERLLEYNLRDVELCVELDREQDIIAFWDEVRTFVGCKLEDATTPGDAVDMYVLHKLHDKFVLPSKGQQEGEDYEGGAVFDPITGVRENVATLDLKCFSGDTDVATPDGLTNIRDLGVGDPVYTLNPDTFECEIKPIVDTQSYDNKYGRLHHVGGNTHDFKVTENHRFLLSKKRGWDDLGPSDYEFDAYRDVPENERFAFPNHKPMQGAISEQFHLYEEVYDGHVAVYAHDGLSGFRAKMSVGVESSLDWVNGTSRLASTEGKVGKYLVPIGVYQEYNEVINAAADEVFLKYDRGHGEIPPSFSMDDWLELMARFVTEGSFTRQRKGIVLHQQNEEGRKSIRSLLDRMGLIYTVDDSRFYISNTILYDWFVDNCGDGYADKRLPEWVFSLDASHLSTILETLIDGDGKRTDSGLRKFWTKSDDLKGAIVRLAIRCGEKPTVSKQSDGTWYVSVGKRGSMKKANATVENHDGQVHCLTAKDNHVVLAGRNGHLQWIGQSLYPMCMVTTNASPETKVDPSSFDGETYRAPNGTHFRKNPDGVIREMVDELLSEREDKKERRNEFSPDTAEYEQFDRQQSAVKVIMNCFTPDTDVLTPTGLRNIRDLDPGNEVFSLDPEEMKVETQPVVETHEYPDYRGKLIDIETSKIDFRVTPNHQMLVRKNETNGITEEEFGFVEAGELDEATNYELPHGWDGPSGQEIDVVDLTRLLDGEYEVWVRPEVHGHTFASELGYYPDKVLKNDIGKEGYVFDSAEFEEHREYLEDVAEQTFVHTEPNRKWIPRTYDADDFLELLAWYVTEGNVYTSETKAFGDKRRGSATVVKVAQHVVTDGGESDHDEIGQLLDRMGFDYYVDERSYQFTSRLLGELFEDICGAGSFDKRIPDMVFEASSRQKERFLETLIAGDGDRQTNSWRYSTVSDQLRDDVLRLCTHLGYTASYNQDSDTHHIYVTEDPKNTLRMHRSSDHSTAENGVYCVTVAENHTLLAGRNGKLQFVGQSLYGVLGWDRFRLYDREMGAAVTATGREVIKYTDEVVANHGYEVVYGDTDSVMLEVGDVSSSDISADVEVTDELREKHPEMNDEELETILATIQKGFELEETINDSYDEFALERLNAEFHRFEIEFEKLYRRFFQAGKKKRYAGHIVWKEGKDVDDIDITGFEYQRSDIAPITKRVQREVIELIVTGADIEEVKEYVHDVVEDYQAGNVSLDDVAIPGGIGKRLDNYETDTAHVRGAKYANLLLGTNFQRGSKPKRLYLKRVHSNFFERIEAEHDLDPAEDPLYAEFKRDPDVICFEYADQIPEEFEVHWEKMLEKTLRGPIARILEALDVSWEEVKAGQEQTGLESFM